MIDQVIYKYHDEMGLVDIDKTIDLISKTYWFAKIKERIATHIENCLKCIVYSSKKGKEEGFFHNIPEDTTPFEVVHIDHHSTGDKSVYIHFKYIFVVIDPCTKFVRLYTIKTTNTKEVINALKNYFRSYSRPKCIVSVLVLPR